MGDGVESSTDKEVEKVLETPDRSKNNQIAESVSKIEDSPVFTFLNNLSPIKPVKSVHISQTINPLNLAALPSVFTSPHVTSLKDSRILRRHKPPDPSKPEFASDGETAVQINEINADCAEQLENRKAKESAEEHSGETSFDCSLFVVDYSEDLSYNVCCPNTPTVSKSEDNADYACDSSKLVSSVPESFQMGGDVNMEERSLIDQNAEVPSCDWDSLISDALMFELPDDTDSYGKSMDPESSYYENLQNEMHTIQSRCSVVSNELPGEKNEHENRSTQPGERTATADARETVPCSSANDNYEEMDNEHLAGIYRGMRRRCLVYEMGSGRRKYLEENFSSMLPENNAFSDDPNVIPVKTENDSPCHHVLPGIGLHLNALATTPKDDSASSRLLIGPGSSLMLNNGVLSANVEKEIAIIPVEDSSICMKTEAIQISPKKKRRRAEQTGDGEGCKRCNCKKSKCLKLYCECFAAGVYCVELCACINCFNKPIHEDTVLATRKQIESRNPLAFAPKVIKGPDQQSESVDDSSTTPASARHKRGCNCKKSGCLKKYCECYQGGVGCSINCRCEGCKNAFGRKDGSHFTGMELEADETNAGETSVPENELNPATPRRCARQSVELPFSSKKKPPKSTRSVLGKRSFLHPTKLDHNLETVREDEMPGFLQDSGIKSLSPNGKRVSPPHNNTGLKSSRKLILQSIPSFPSLTQNQ